MKSYLLLSALGLVLYLIGKFFVLPNMLENYEPVLGLDIVLLLLALAGAWWLLFRTPKVIAGGGSKDGDGAGDPPE